MIEIRYTQEDYENASGEEKRRIHEQLHQELTAACGQGDAMGYAYLGYFCENGLFGFDEDLDKAFELYEKGMELGDSYCEDAVARMTTGDEEEYEVGEDDWSMDPDIDLRFQTCSECVEGAVSRVQNREKEWEVADIVSKFISTARCLLDDGAMLLELCELSVRLEDFIFDHPRLKLSFKELQLDLVRALEARGEDAGDIPGELSSEIESLKSSIALADEGRLSEIPQSGHLRKDPVEWTKEWEEHIDEADRIAYSKMGDFPRGMGFCFGFWPERRSALLSFGIKWKDPHMMNPRVIFD